MNFINRELKFPLPEGFDLNARVPTSCIAWAVISLVLIALALIALFTVTRYKHKGSWMGIFGGVAVYFVFYYCAVKIVMFPVSIIGRKGLMPLYIVLAALTAAVVPILGRMFAMKFFKANIKNISDALSFGVGVMVTEGLASIINLFMAVVSSNTLNSAGIETILTENVDTKEQFDSLIDSINAILGYDVTTYVVMGIMTISFMIFHLVVSISLFAAFTDKVPKSWYAISMSAYFGMQLFKYMSGYGVINSIIETVGTVAITAAFVYFTMKIYNKYYKSEEFAFQKKQKEEEEKKNKVPRFKNLDKL